MTTPVTQTALEVWLNPTDDELQDADPMSLVPRVMATYSVEQGELLRQLTHHVTDLSDRIADVSDYMNVVNTGMGALKNATESDRYYFKYFDNKADADAEIARWVAVGAQPLNSDGSMGIVAVPSTDGAFKADTVGTHTGTYYGVFFQKAAGEAMQKNLQNKVNDLTTANQQAQLVLQTIMGRMNATIELISNIVKKNSTQLEAIIQGLHR